MTISHMPFASSNYRLNTGEIASINPQPLPPGSSELNRQFLNRGDLVSLNPQPLPPEPPPTEIASRVLNPGDEISLNPQPLPPKVFSEALFSPLEVLQGSEAATFLR